MSGAGKTTNVSGEGVDPVVQNINLAPDTFQCNLTSIGYELCGWTSHFPF